MTAFSKGDLVIVAPSMARPQDRGRIWRIDKVPTGARGVNYVATPVEKRDGTWTPTGDRGLRGPEEIWQAYDENVGVGVPYAAQVEAFVVSPNVGSIVRTTARLGGIDAAATLFVVLGTVSGSPDRTRVAPVGGDDRGGYWKVANSTLTVVAGTFVPEGE